MRFFQYGCVAALPLVSGSCGSGSSNIQATDMVRGSGNLAGSAFRATAVATLRQPVTTARLGLSVLWHRPREVISGNLPFELIPQPLTEEAPGSVEFENRLDREHFPRAREGTLKWLVDGPGFFPEFDRQIAAARKSIDVQVYIFDNDDIAVRYADVLKKRASEVKVHVLFDDMGSHFAQTSAPETPGPAGFAPPADMHDYLERKSKAAARLVLNPWLVADHTKLMVFDHETAILGGMNIGREYYSEWHDLMVKVEGPVVENLSREFTRAWRKAGPWGDLALVRKPVIFNKPKPMAGGVPLRILRTDPAEGKHQILEATLLAIRGARKRIWIENPYFAQDDIALAVAAAARRGVDVRVVLPARGDSTVMDVGNLSTAQDLIRAGAKVMRYPRMTHMKVMICDDWACVGSANLDTLSMRINRELNLAFSHPAAVRELEKAVFLPDFRASREMTLEETKSIGSKLAEAIADQL